MHTTNFDVVRSGNGWRAIHRPSGLSVPVDFHRRQDALDIAHDLEAIGDWSAVAPSTALLQAGANFIMERLHP